MKIKSLDRSDIVITALDLVPPLIRQSLLNDPFFMENHGLKAEATITIGPSNISFQQSSFLNAIRSALAKHDSFELADIKDKIWILKNEAHNREPPELTISSEQQRIVLPSFSLISNDVSTRIRYLEETTSDVNLPDRDIQVWRKILEQRPLDDQELDTFHDDIKDTPVFLERTIRNEILAGESSVSTLIPNSRRYFERLVGAYDGSSSIQDYAHNVGKGFFSKLICWHPYNGLLFSLFLSSHWALTDEIDTTSLDKEVLEKAFDYVEKNGDILSRLGAFDVGFRILVNRPEIEPYLLRLLYRIRDDDVEDITSEFNLFSALFVLVDGELARTHLFTNEPPFYRRLASLAQAALIQRQLIQCGIDYQHFAEWAISNRGEQFYMQSLADMRIEPRWYPDLATAPQLKAEFFGRILIVANKFKLNVASGELIDAIFGSNERSIKNIFEFPYPYLPGPLESSTDNQNSLPDDLAKTIEEQLRCEEVNASSFIALVNSAMVFNVKSTHADLAAMALRLGNYTLANLQDKPQLVGVLNGLASVAAISRNTDLADELRILMRRYRRDPQYSFSIDDALRMSLIACSAWEDTPEWRTFVGEWITELAFGDFEGNEGEVFHSRLSALLHSVPELWVSCAKADSALEAWSSR
ncbi:hypothetical protein [Marinobacterium sp. MBR-109]|uniref:hypothetical protein n=1 Tax=Marinobacterium sp. MBR-109 TaxID=3156462 RepID=UPI003394A765